VDTLSVDEPQALINRERRLRCGKNCIVVLATDTWWLATPGGFKLIQRPEGGSDMGVRTFSGQIIDAQDRLQRKLTGLDLRALGVSEYTQRYLGSYLPRLKGVLQRYGKLLYLATKGFSGSLQDFSLVDYGGGSGLISLLALEMGIGTVVYNDIYDVSCSDATIISSAIGLPLKHVVCGDVDELVRYVKANNIAVNAVVSNDVLEHIYDLERHFLFLAQIGEHRVVYATSANGANPLIARRIRKEHIRVEYVSRHREWGHKERDTLEAYFDARKRIIANYAPSLQPDEVEYLARATRGLKREDILKCVDEYLQTGQVSYRINDPTNTCDPYTGNWCERLIDMRWLKRIIEKAGYSSVEILPGYYAAGGSLPKMVAKTLMNTIIKILGKNAVFLAPYYVLLAEKR